jgi:hypothetical protein
MINVALYHCIGPSIQTALFNAPLAVMVAWSIGKPLDLNFEIFMICLLVLSILVVGNFLRDGESNWLEGALLVVRIFESNELEAKRINLKAGCLRHHSHCMLVLSGSRRGNLQWFGRIGHGQCCHDGGDA